MLLESLIVCVLVIEIFSFIYYTFTKSAGKAVLEFLLYRQVLEVSPEKQGASQAAPQRFSEHAFTGWSLNPDFRNTFGERIHNREGFRGDLDLDQIDSSSIRIYCGGESTTYCTDLEKNEETWAAHLEVSLATRFQRKFQVLNAGVPGFNSLQSFVRLASYLDWFQPHLVIIYHHAKNDLTPLYSGDPAVLKPLPDYSNLMRGINFVQMKASITPFAYIFYFSKVWAMWHLSEGQRNILRYAYGDMPYKPNVPQLLARRCDPRIFVNWHRNIVALCRDRNIPLVYITQRVNAPDIKDYLKMVNDSVRVLDAEQKKCFVYDLDREFPEDPNLFVDKLHFSREGCRKMANLLTDFIQSRQVLKGLMEQQSI